MCDGCFSSECSCTTACILFLEGDEWNAVRGECISSGSPSTTVCILLLEGETSLIPSVFFVTYQTHGPPERNQFKCEGCVCCQVSVCVHGEWDEQDEVCEGSISSGFSSGWIICILFLGEPGLIPTDVCFEGSNLFRRGRQTHGLS